MKNQSAHAKFKEVSRSRVPQVLNLLKLDKSFIKNEQIGDKTERRIISEKRLHKIINKNKKK